jgi:hypothetical protein
MNVRVFGTVGRLTDYWAGVTLDYTLALLASKVNVKLISVYGVYLDQDWDLALPALQATLQTPFINVAIGFGGGLDKVWTAGCVNVAVSGGTPRIPNPVEVTALKQFEHLVVPRGEDLIALEAVGLQPKHVSAQNFASYLERLK